MNFKPSALLALAVSVVALTSVPAMAQDAPDPYDGATEVGRPADVEVRKAPAPAEPAPAERSESAASLAPAEAAPSPTAPTEVDESLGRFTRIYDSTWRQSQSRQSSEAGSFDGRHFLAELRFGAYLPRVDDEFGGAATPYADFFGTSPKFYFGFEVDWLPVRIPYVGSLGIGAGWATISATAKAKTSTGDAGSDTSLSIRPIHAVAVLRADGLLRQFGFPLVPYVKGGLGVGMWKASGPNGTSQVGSTIGEGTTLGVHFAVGGALSLATFDRRTAMAMREQTGIQHAYVWGEWLLANLDGFGASDVMNVGTSTGIGGVALEY
jgi:hypothetical protein